MHSSILASCTALLFFLQGSRAAAAYLFGGIVGLGNLMGIQWIVTRVLNKKSVALTVLAIVIKYAFLIIFLFVLTNRLKDEKGALVAGVLTIVGSIVLSTLGKKLQ